MFSAPMVVNDFARLSMNIKISIALSGYFLRLFLALALDNENGTFGKV